MFYFKGDRLIDVDVLVGCFWMVRREALDQFGLLDDGFFMYAEDVDWCRRCWNAGWRVTFFPEAEAIHYRGGSSTKKDPVWIAVTQQQSILRYWKKHHGFFGALALRLVMILHKTVRWILFFFRSITAPASKGTAREQMRVSCACLLDLLSGKPVSG
jgi:GT2 family glycosyltransferase